MIAPDLQAVFAKIETKVLVEELADRADGGDEEAIAALVDDDEPLGYEGEALLADLTEFERDELKRAVTLDDGPRALELLRRAM